MCVVGEILPRAAFRGSNDVNGYERGRRQVNQGLRDQFTFFGADQGQRGPSLLTIVSSPRASLVRRSGEVSSCF